MMLGFAEEEEGDVRQEFLDEGDLEEVDDDEEDSEDDIHPSGRTRNAFNAEECEVLKRGREEDGAVLFTS